MDGEAWTITIKRPQSSLRSVEIIIDCSDVHQVRAKTRSLMPLPKRIHLYLQRKSDSNLIFAGSVLVSKREQQPL
jgi:hypothetical protein